MAIVTRKNKNTTRYQVRVRGYDGKWISETFPTKREALAREVELKHKKSNGEHVVNSFNKITLDEFWLQWRDVVNGTSSGWQKSQKQMYRDHIHPVIGHLKLSLINPSNISSILRGMEEKGCAPQTRKHVYGLLKIIFSSAVDDFEILTKSPVKKKHCPKLIKKESEHLNYEEVLKLLNYTKDKPLGLAIWIQILCGLRVGEVMYLRWEHVDFENKFLQIRGTWRRKENSFVDYPKGKRWHRVKIPYHLMQIFIEANRNVSSSSYIVRAIKSDTHVDYGTLYKRLKSYIKELGFDHRIATQNLRHSAHSVYMKHGASEEDMKELLNHRSVETTRRYIHGGHRPENSIDKIADSIHLEIPSTTLSMAS